MLLHNLGGQRTIIEGGMHKHWLHYPPPSSAPPPPRLHSLRVTMKDSPTSMEWKLLGYKHAIIVMIQQ